MPDNRKQPRVLVLFAAPNLFGMERAVIETFDMLHPDIEPHFLMSYATVRKHLPQLDEVERRNLPHSFFSDRWDWKHVVKPKSPRHLGEMILALALSNADVLRHLRGADAIYIPTIHQLYYAIIASALFRLGGRKVIFEFHNVFLRRSSSLHTLQPLITTFVNGSEFGEWCTRTYQPFIPDSKLVLIPRSVDRPAGYVEPLRDYRDRRNVVFIGQVSAAKGPDLLVEACSLLSGDYPDIFLHIVGSGDAAFEERLAGQIASSGLSGHVRCWGYQQEARAWLNGAYVHVQPTRPSLFHESSPRVVVEAMAAGVPSIVFRSGGLQNSVVHNETGLICEQESAACLAENLRRLLDDRSLRDRYGAAALRRYESRYSPECVRDQWLKLFCPR